MFSLPNMISDTARRQRFPDNGLDCRIQYILSIKRIYAGGLRQCQKLTPGICPNIAGRTRYIQRPGRYQRQQFVLIERQGLLIIGVYVEILAEPMPETENPMKILADPPLRERRSAASGVIRNNHRKPGIIRPGPQCRFPKPGVPHDSHPGSIDPRLPGRQIIQNPTIAPGPNGYGSALVSRDIGR